MPRFLALRELGLDFISLVSGSADTPRDVGVTSLKLPSSEILPGLKQPSRADASA